MSIYDDMFEIEDYIDGKFETDQMLNLKQSWEKVSAYINKIESDNVRLRHELDTFFDLKEILKGYTNK